MAGKARSAIVNALITKFKLIDGSGAWNTNLNNNVTNKLIF